MTTEYIEEAKHPQLKLQLPVDKHSSLKPSKNTVETISTALIVIFSIGLGIVLGLTFISVTKSQLEGPGGVAMFLGNVTAMIGTYLALILVVLISRNYLLEKVLGQDQLVHWHKKVAPWSLILISVHVVLTTIGFSQYSKTNVFSQLSSFVNSFPNMLTAIIAFGCMALSGILSIKYIRLRIKRELWWTVHLLMYLALIISFAHIIGLGPAFVGHPLATHIWTAAWILVAAVILTFRFAIPIYKNMYHNLRVESVQTLSEELTSIICSGYNLNKFQVSGGQFFYWRFIAKGIWWQAHPYSVSAMPSDRYVRITVKSVGDFSKDIRTLRQGTRVLVEGPYGTFTKYRQATRKALLISGGIGMTALRSLLEDLPTKSQPVVINRVTEKGELVFHDEILELIKLKKGALHEVIGRREKVNFDATMIKKLVPDVLKRDVFLCGSQQFIDHTLFWLNRLGVPSDLIHFEVFSL